MGEPKITQLKDDCFALNGEMMTVADAIAMLEETTDVPSLIGRPEVIAILKEYYASLA